MKPTVMLVILSLALLPNIHTQNFSAFKKECFENDKGEKLPYRILFPKNYDSTQKYPLILFLHGSGERGDDNKAQLVHGAEMFLDKINQYPSIVVLPQCPKDFRWSNVDWDSRMEDGTCNMPLSEKPTKPMGLVLQLLDELLESKSIDTDRIYLGGLSMGGFGTFDLLARKPDFFAAAIPICGGGNPLVAKLYAENTSIWIFHGDADTVVPVEGSRKMYRVLKESGADVQYKEYPGVKHDSWTNVFAEPDLFKWLFSKKLHP